MERTYRKIADAAVKLEGAIERPFGMADIGVDGILTAYFLRCAAAKRGAPQPVFELPFQVSSKNDEKKNDMKSFWSALKAGSILEVPVYGVDMRAKTGRLGEELKGFANYAGKATPGIDFKYSVLFDKNQKADLRGSLDELKDEEIIRWYDKPADNPIQLINGLWKYQTLKGDLEKLNHVLEIRDMILN